MRPVLFFILLFNFSFAQTIFSFNEINSVKDPGLKTSLKNQEKTVNAILKILSIGDEGRRIMETRTSGKMSSLSPENPIENKILKADSLLLIQYRSFEKNKIAIKVKGDEKVSALFYTQAIDKINASYVKYNKGIGIFQKYTVYDEKKKMKRYHVFPGCEKFADNPDELNTCGKKHVANAISSQGISEDADSSRARPLTLIYGVTTKGEFLVKQMYMSSNDFFLDMSVISALKAYYKNKKVLPAIAEDGLPMHTLRYYDLKLEM
ncbi:hypothetical protein [Chryseobacterium sp. 2987]|uniref:hypothetical protein n=1 Tax=Chryseobacterium sp. 2987 TaxID=2817767 RepID=UPI0028652500|nr:hypothetical protein [Chryseobacterium sp. 2987]MDR6919359.1 hypothetical protein [Chryseobacterium sp. 2987]